ncbi:phage holin family protein [Synechococcus sp. H55.7]|uniref:phage holin family protein n=1 Tax=unclassified Synechococcus TaxID=2626047 RepID=UPI0039C4046F
MATLLATWLMSALSVMILAWLLPGIHVSGFGGALVAALAIGLVNGLVRPFLRLITLPITVLTLGLFWLILNGICLAIADKLAGDAFNIDNFGWAFLGAIVLSVVSGLVQRVFEQGVQS